jgi:hypothetical protein
MPGSRGQLREATSFSQHPTHLIGDNDRTFGPAFSAVAAATGIDEVRTASSARKSMPLVSACWAACLDHLLILNEAHVLRLLRE